MAVPKIFTETIDVIKGLRANSDYTIFFYRFKINGKEFTKTIDFSKKTWQKRERVRNAVKNANDFRDIKSNIINNLFDPDTKLNDITHEYFAVSKDTDWNRQLKKQYELYIQKAIGNKSVGKIIKNDIDKIHANMRKEGKTKQNINGCSDRSIHKVLNQILKPILSYAYENGAIRKVPSFPKFSTVSKKEVENASEKLAVIYRVITTRYRDDPYYRALFLFALHGRRWNEIRTLAWENISLENNSYTIIKEYNKIKKDQTYILWEPIKTALNEIKKDVGLVFKSPITGKELYSPKKQLAHIRDEANIPELTMHYFRHIYVTALVENEIATTALSAALGHTNSQTVDRHYRTVNHLRGSKTATIALSNILDVEVLANDSK